MGFDLFHESDSLVGKRLSFDAELNVVFNFHVQLGFVDSILDFSREASNECGSSGWFLSFFLLL